MSLDLRRLKAGSDVMMWCDVISWGWIGLLTSVCELGSFGLLQNSLVNLTLSCKTDCSLSRLNVFVFSAGKALIILNPVFISVTCLPLTTALNNGSLFLSECRNRDADGSCGSVGRPECCSASSRDIVCLTHLHAWIMSGS